MVITRLDNGDSITGATQQVVVISSLLSRKELSGVLARESPRTNAKNITRIFSEDQPYFFSLFFHTFGSLCTILYKFGSLIARNASPSALLVYLTPSGMYPIIYPILYLIMSSISVLYYGLHDVFH